MQIIPITYFDLEAFLPQIHLVHSSASLTYEEQIIIGFSRQQQEF